MHSAADNLGVLFAAGVLLVFLFIVFRMLGAPRSRRRPPHPVGRRTDTSRELGGGWHGATLGGSDARPRSRDNAGDDGGGSGSSSDGGGGDGGGGGGGD